MQPEKELLLGLLHNTHESLKWMWQIVMGAALVIAVQSTYPSVEIIFNSIIDDQVIIKSQNIETIIIFCIGFLPLYFRVFYGDSRFIDLSYMEAVILKNRNMDKSVNFSQFTGFSRFLDISSLIIHAILFIYLSSSLDKPLMFIYLATFFLIFNSLWLVLIIVRNDFLIRIPNLKNYTQRMYARVLDSCNEKPRNDAILFWVINNITHSVVLIGVIILTQYYNLEELFIYLAAFFLLTNSVIDLVVTWEFYFPNFQEFVDLYEQ